MNRLGPELSQGKQSMSKNLNKPTPGTADDNPYAPPQTPIGGAGSAEVPGDMAEAEAVRRKYLSHEASVASIGSLHYLGVIIGVIALAMTFSAPCSNPRGARGNRLSAVRCDSRVFVCLRVRQPLTGYRLDGTEILARWTEVVLSSILLLIYLIVIVSTAVQPSNPETGPTIGGSVVLSLILGYILFLLLTKKGSIVFSPEYRLIIERTPHIKYRTSWILKGCLIFVVVVILLAVIGAILSRWR